MRIIVICSLLLAAPVTQAFAAAHLTAAKMLEDAAFNHDLARIRMTFQHDVQGRYDAPSRENSSGSPVSKR
jgi:methionine-rich copper-binding protein CopC